MNSRDIDIQPGAASSYAGLQAAFRATLVAPQDDMWAAFADAAEHHELTVNGIPAGCISLNEDREALFFHLNGSFEHLAEPLLRESIDRLKVVAAMPSTVDPGFLSVCLDVGRVQEPKALMFQHVHEPKGAALSGLRLAGTEMHPEVVAFVEKATGMPTRFLNPYMEERIQKGQLLLHHDGSDIVATGECRDDERVPGYAHLGLIVSENQRGQGLGGRLMHALVLESRSRNLQPICSTEPENLPARSVIQKSGFIARHRVYRVSFSD